LRFTHVRPNAIWTEPSYLGYAMLSFMMMNQSFYRLGGTDRPVFALMILCGLMSQALSFVMFLIILLGLGVYTNKSMARYRTAVTVVGLVGVIVMIAVGGAGFVGDRLSKAGGASGDFSLFVRIFGPVGILPEYLRDHPLGVPFSDRLPALLAYTGQLGINPLEYTVNSITNFFFYYGLVGVPIVFLPQGARQDVWYLSVPVADDSGREPRAGQVFSFCYVALVHRFITQKLPQPRLAAQRAREVAAAPMTTSPTLPLRLSHRAWTAPLPFKGPFVKPLDAQASGSLDGGPSFSLSNRLGRALWNVTWALLASWTPPPLNRWRCFLLRLFGAKIGKGVRFYGSARVWHPANLVLEDGVVVGPGANCYNQGHIYIGYKATVSQGAHLCASSHDVNDYHNQLTLRPIRIEGYAWIAAEGFVGPGVTVGEGAVLGARGVAMRDLVPWTIYRGNPAAEIGKRAFRNQAEGVSLYPGA
jgi:putative colanic acid biosynthesis acetyltransferase WcaF